MFCGLAIDEEVARAIDASITGVRQRLPMFRWIPPQNWHLTLKFYGEVPVTSVEGIANALERTGSAAIPVAIRGAGAFPDMRAPRVLWIGVHETKKKLRDLYRRINVLSAQIGLPTEDRKLRPHITVARAGKTARPVARELTPLMDTPIIETSLNRLVLWRSDLSEAGPTYTVVREITLPG